MGFGVFIHRSDSIYDDRPAERYQFPPQYLTRVQACIGDWIVYYEPRKVPGTRGYFAVARVQDVIDDPGAPGMYLALIEPGSYLDFPDPVPFADAAGVVERGVLNASGRISGRAQAAVRPLSPDDFGRIVARGLGDSDHDLPRVGSTQPDSEFAQDQAPYEYERTRERVTLLITRANRDRLFRRLVLDAYGERCAISGLKLINGGGRAEVEAAHIRPVEADGPDEIRNGIALSGTVHWMFDRGLISLSDEFDVLVSRQANNVEGVRALINESGRAFRPRHRYQMPHPRFLSWHRENTFKS